MPLQPLIALIMLFQSGIADLPPLYDADIKVVMPDLVTILAVAEWDGHSLVLSHPLEPGREVRLIISHAPSGLLLVPDGLVSPSGRDILIQRDGLEDGYTSFRNILNEQDIDLYIPVD